MSLFTFLFVLSIVSLLARVLPKLPIFDTTKQEETIADEWNKIKTNRSSN